MTQQVKKAPAAQTTAKMASGAATKVTQTAYNAAETTRKSAQNVVNISSSAMRDMIASGTGEAQKAQEKVFEMGREGVENLARSADVASKVLLEVINIGRENMEACVECSTVAASTAQQMTSEISDAYNRCFSEAVDLSKEAFACRTLNDVMDLQNKAVKSMLDMWFSESNKLSNMMFECCTNAIEPMNSRFTESSDRLMKVMSA